MKFGVTGVLDEERLHVALFIDRRSGVKFGGVCSGDETLNLVHILIVNLAVESQPVIRIEV